jgi:hypothetical protein
MQPPYLFPSTDRLVVGSLVLKKTFSAKPNYIFILVK